MLVNVCYIAVNQQHSFADDHAPNSKETAYRYQGFQWVLTSLHRRSSQYLKDHLSWIEQSFDSSNPVESLSEFTSFCQWPCRFHPVES